LAAGLKKAGILEGTFEVIEDSGTTSIVLPSIVLTNSAISQLCTNALFITAERVHSFFRKNN
jgi:hypothetical protein